MLQTRDRLSIPMHQVDAHNVVPVWEASGKKETAARTIRKKIHTKLPTYLTVQTDSPCGKVICSPPAQRALYLSLHSLVLVLESKREAVVLTAQTQMI